jgi:adenylate cyclase
VDANDSLDVARRKLTGGLRALGAGDDEARAIAPVLSYLLGVDPEGHPDIEPEQLRRQIALAAGRLMEWRLDRQPLLIVIDDLQWADAASVELLHHVVDQLADRRVMMLLSHRPDVRLPAVARATLTVLPVRPLSATETRGLVAGLFGPSSETLEPVQDLIAARAGGNPFFVEELVRSLVGKGLLVRQPRGWVCPTGCEGVDVPPTLHGLLLARVDRLPLAVRSVLELAAVLGVDIDAALLQSVTAAPSSLKAALDALVEADLIQPLGGRGDMNRYRFTHALLREVVYYSLLLSRRTELHERVGRALESLAGSHPERLRDLEALGHHWSLSADRPRGARHLVAAGEWARTVFANDDAIRHYARAYQILTGCAGCDIEARAAREQLADLLALAGRRPEAFAHYEAMRQALADAPDRTTVARLQRKLAVLHWEAGDRARADACLAAGLEWLGAEGDPIERAHLLQESGRLAFRAGNHAAAIAWAERALMAVPEGDAATPLERAREAAAARAQAYNTLGVALARTGRLAEAVDRIERSIELATASRLLQAACRGYTNLGVLYSSLDPRRSIDTCLRGLDMAKRIGDLGYQARLSANLAVAYCTLTDRCEAEGIAAATLAVDLDRRLGLIDHLPVPLIILSQIHQCHGDGHQALTMYEEALRVAEQVGDPQLLVPCYDGLATVHLDAGDHALASTYLALAQELCERAGIEPDALLVLPFLC